MTSTSCQNGLVAPLVWRWWVGVDELGLGGEMPLRGKEVSLWKERGKMGVHTGYGVVELGFTRLSIPMS